LASTKINKSSARFIAFFATFLVILAVTNPPLRNNLITYILLLGVTYFGFLFSSFKDQMIGIEFKGERFTRALIWGVSIGALFVFLTSRVPGFSLGLPVLPSAISNTITIFIIVIVAPIAEELFFRGYLIGLLRSTKIGKRNVLFVIIVQAVIFAAAHVGAYIFMIYAYPSFVAGLSAIQANIGSFIAAGTFGLVAGAFVVRKRIQNLVFSIILHMIINFWVLRPFVIVT